MKRLLACLAICTSLSASAQDDNCTVLGVQELSGLYANLSTSVDTVTQGWINLLNALESSSSTIDTTVVVLESRQITAYTVESNESSVNTLLAQGWHLYGPPSFPVRATQCTCNPTSIQFRQALVQYADE